MYNIILLFIAMAIGEITAQLLITKSVNHKNYFNIYFYLALIAFLFTYCFLYILMRSTKHGHHIHHLHNIAFLHSIHHSFVAVILLISGFLIYSHTIDILQLFALAMIITGTYILVTNTKKT
jgi:hypothetical protein